MDTLVKKIETSITTQILYIVGAIFTAIVLIVGLFALSMKSNNYGKNYLVAGLIVLTIFTISADSVMFYVVHDQILSDDGPTNRKGIKTFITIAAILLLFGGALLMYVLYSAQGVIQIQGFNYFASFMIFQFCLMTAITVIINKSRTL